MPVRVTSWRPLLLCSLLVSQKFMDDKNLTNGSFSFIYCFFTTEQLNMLEKKFLELIHYNVTVRGAVYTRYYFELRALFKDNPRDMDLEILGEDFFS